MRSMNLAAVVAIAMQLWIPAQAAASTHGEAGTGGETCRAIPWFQECIGPKYVGDCSSGLADGKGTAVCEVDGRKAIHEGMFKNGARHGWGTYTSPSGVRWEGMYRDNEPVGKQITRRPNGQMEIRTARPNNDPKTRERNPVVFDVGRYSEAEAEQIRRSAAMDPGPSGGPDQASGAALGASPEGQNIADAFHRDSPSAIRHYASARAISINVADVVTRDGKVYLIERQVPTSVQRDAKQMAQKPFSWDNFYRQSQQGVGNVYANVYTVACIFSMQDFAQMSGVAKGRVVNVSATLNSYSGTEIAFDCKPK